MGASFTLYFSALTWFRLVLDPRKKLSHFKKHWVQELQDEALENMEETVCFYSSHLHASVLTDLQFKERYLEMHAHPTTQTPRTTKPTTDRSGLRALTPDDDDDDESNLTQTHVDPEKPWLDEYNLYFNTRESLPPGMTTIEWWGVR